YIPGSLMRHLVLPVFVAIVFLLSAETVWTDELPASNQDSWQTIPPQHNVHAVLGKGVWNDAGESLGRIVDILVDESGQVRAVVIDFGGFLGVGARRLLVDWTALHLNQHGSIAANISRDQARAVPEYK